MQQTFPADFGDYVLLRKLAQGGMAEIFVAKEKKTGRICALKRILPHLAQEEGFIRMFLDEARIVTHLDHPNVARVYEHGKHDGYYFMALEFVDGHSLLVLADQARAQKIPLPRGLLAYVIGELLSGLGHAHNARDNRGRALGVVHRDVTPQNVMIGYDGVVRLIDFGVAKARARLTKTEAGFTKGKLSYMSPEQARGEELDGRSDLFSVGIILYEITTGHRLFNKEGPGGILSAIVNDPIPLPSKKIRDYPKELEQILMRSLEKEVRKRWQTAEDMSEALQAFASREKPRPGQKRLADLLSDLCGQSPHEVKARAAREDQRSRAKQALVRDRVASDSTNAGSEAPIKRQEETRMLLLDPASGTTGQRSGATGHRMNATSAMVPVLSGSLSQARVPDPTIPFRVRFAQSLAFRAQNARVSWRTRKGRYLVAFAAALGVFVFGTAHLLGVTTRMRGWFGAAADRAREFKTSTGLDPRIADGGVTPTVLVLVSEPPGASVSIGGMGAGCTTPCELTEFPLGAPFEATFELPGHRLSRETITAFPNTGRIEYSVTLASELGTLVVESLPVGAKVRVDGQDLRGGTPVTLDGVKADQPFRVEVTKAGYLSQARVVLVRDQETRRELFELEIDRARIPPGRLSVESEPANCRVEARGEPLGNTPLRDQSLKAGTYLVRVVCPNYSPEQQTVKVISGKSAQLSFVLRPNVFGYLTLETVPPSGVQVKLNGRPVRTPVEFMKVIPGRHEVEVIEPRLGKKKRLTVEVGPEARITRIVNLYQ